MRSSRIASILKSALELPNSEGPVHVSGTSASARALIASRLTEFSSPLLLFCPDDDRAAELASDIETLGEVVLHRQIRALHFPTWEQSPYSPIAPSLRTRFSRLAVLSSLASLEETSGEGLVIVTTIAAFSQATLPRATFQEFSRSLLSGSALEGGRDLLARQLTDAGYLRTDPVEDPGSFAIRGDIVDIFPPGRAKPLRLELFGDEIELIRDFDPSTQRTLGEGLRETLLIPPAREVLVNSKTIPLIRERLKARADDLDISRGVRDPLLEAVSHGGFPDHCDAWAPFCYDRPGTLWDFFGKRSPIILWDDELGCHQVWDERVAEQARMAGELRQAGLVLPAPGELFSWSPAMDKQFSEGARLFFDQLELRVA